MAELRGAVARLEASLASTEAVRDGVAQEKAQLQALVASHAAEAERLGAELQQSQQRVEELMTQCKAASPRDAVADAPRPGSFFHAPGPCCCTMSIAVKLFGHI